MTIELRYRDNGKGVLFVCTGVVTASEIAEANKEIYSDERLQTLRYQLIDYSGVERIDLSSDEIRTLAAMDSSASERNPEFLIAVVSPSDLSYGITRVWQAIIDEAELENSVFRTIAEAELWIKESMNTPRE